MVSAKRSPCDVYIAPAVPKHCEVLRMNTLVFRSCRWSAKKRTTKSLPQKSRND